MCTIFTFTIIRILLTVKDNSILMVKTNINYGKEPTLMMIIGKYFDLKNETTKLRTLLLDTK